MESDSEMDERDRRRLRRDRVRSAEERQRIMDEALTNIRRQRNTHVAEREIRMAERQRRETAQQIHAPQEPVARRSITMSPQPSDRYRQERRSVTFSAHSVEQPDQLDVTGPSVFFSEESIDERYTELNSREAVDYGISHPNGYESDTTEDSVFTRSESVQSYETIEDLDMYQDRRRVASDGQVQAILKEREQVQRDLESEDSHRRTASDTHVQKYRNFQPENLRNRATETEFGHRLPSAAEPLYQGDRSIDQEKIVLKQEISQVPRQVLQEREQYRNTARETRRVGSKRDGKFSVESIEQVDREIRMLDERLMQLRKNSERAKQELENRENNATEYVPRAAALSERNETEKERMDYCREYDGKEPLPQDDGFMKATDRTSSPRRDRNGGQAKAFQGGLTRHTYLPDEGVSMIGDRKSDERGRQNMSRLKGNGNELEYSGEYPSNIGTSLKRNVYRIEDDRDFVPNRDRVYSTKQYSIPRAERQREAVNETYVLPEGGVHRYRDEKVERKVRQKAMPTLSSRQVPYHERDEYVYSRPKYYERDRMEEYENSEDERNVKFERDERISSKSKRQIPVSETEICKGTYSRAKDYNRNIAREYGDFHDSENEIDEQRRRKQLDKLHRQKRRILEMKAREEEIRQKEIDLERRERQLKYQLEEESEQGIDPYEAELALKEKELEEKMALLRTRERQLANNEAMNKATVYRNRNESTATKEVGQPVLLKKEIMTAANAEDKQTEIVTPEMKDLVVPKEQIIKQKDLKRIDRGTDAFPQEKAPFFPKFTTFSGDEPKQKKEITFEEWKYEVQCTLKEGVVSHQAIAQAIRKSLIGQAKQVLMSSGTTAKIDEILKRLERVFGNVASGESTLQEFYTATQKQSENVVAWGLRLEEIIKNAVDKGHVKQEATNNMLKNRFWKGLRTEKLKNRTQIHFINIDDYQELLSRVREEENEMKLNPGVQYQPVTFSKDNSESSEASNLDCLLQRLTSMEENMKELNKKCDIKPKPRPFGLYKRNNKDGDKTEARETTEDETTLKPLN